jgi:hypothetical protein
MYPGCGAVASGKSQRGRFFKLRDSALINIKGSGALAASITESLMRHHDRRTTAQSRRWRW